LGVESLDGGIKVESDENGRITVAESSWLCSWKKKRERKREEGGAKA